MERKGLFFMAAAILAHSLYYITDKAGISAGSDPGSFAIVRGLSALVFVVIAFIILEKRLPKIPRENLKDLAIIGILGSGIAVLLRVYGLVTTTATKASIMQGMIALFTIISSYFLIRERLPKRFFIIFIFMVIGSVFVITEGKLEMPAEGDILILASAVIFGFNNSYTEKMIKKLNNSIVLFGRAFFGFLFLVIAFTPLKLSGFGYVSYEFGVLAGIMFFFTLFFYYKAIETFGASTSASFLIISPALTFIIANIYLGETLSLIQIVGAILILGGSVFLTKVRKGS